MTCDHITSSNEAMRHEFISSVLHSVASCYDGKVKVCLKYDLSGSHGKGPVDWVIKVGDTIIVVIEAKREDINQEVGQNAIQLQASFQCNKEKRKYKKALNEEIMYGIVSTGADWVITKLIITGDINNNGNVDVLLSTRSPFALPINEIEFDENVCVIVWQIKWVFVGIDEAGKNIESKIKLQIGSIKRNCLDKFNVEHNDRHV